MGSLTPKEIISCKMSNSASLPPELVLWSSQKEDYNALNSIKIVSFNVLAPCYKRLSQNIEGKTPRESSQRELWEERARKTIAFFKSSIFPYAHIIGLQEFWVAEYYQEIFREGAEEFGYKIHSLQRTGLKADAVAFMVHNSLEVLAFQEVFLCSISDRVALILKVRDKVSGRYLLIANTHLSFPHSDFDRFNQLRQIYTLAECIEEFAVTHNIKEATRIVMGDLNVINYSTVCDHLRSSGYVSCLYTCPPLDQDGNPVDVLQLVTHRNHKQEELGVDHIFVKPEQFSDSIKVTDSPIPAAFIESTEVVPNNLTATQWVEGFNLSDHRPISAHIVLGVKRT